MRSIAKCEIWNNQRVVTFKDIDMVHQRPRGTAKRNYNKNKNHFIENEDFYKISQYEFRTAFNIQMNDKQKNDIMLFTESGYLMLVKSFRDDSAWKVQRQLVNSYFNTKEEHSKEVLEKDNDITRLEPHQWYNMHKAKLKAICGSMGWDRKYLYHKILTEVNELYDINFYNEQYKKETGKEPAYAMDIVEYFPQIREDTEKYIDYLYKASCGNEPAEIMKI